MIDSIKKPDREPDIIFDADFQWWKMELWLDEGIAKIGSTIVKSIMINGRRYNPAEYVEYAVEGNSTPDRQKVAVDYLVEREILNGNQ